MEKLENILGRKKTSRSNSWGGAKKYTAIEIEKTGFDRTYRLMEPKLQPLDHEDRKQGLEYMINQLVQDEKVVEWQICKETIDSQNNSMCPFWSMVWCGPWILGSITRQSKWPNWKKILDCNMLTKNRIVSNMLEDSNLKKGKMQNILCDFHPKQILGVLCKDWDQLCCSHWVIQLHIGHNMEPFDLMDNNDKSNLVIEIEEYLVKCLEEENTLFKIKEVQNWLVTQSENIQTLKNQMLKKFEKLENHINGAQSFVTEFLEKSEDSILGK